MAESPEVELEDGRRERMETLNSGRMAQQDGTSNLFAAEQKLSSNPSDWSIKTESKKSKGHDNHDEEPSYDSKSEGIVPAEEGEKEAKKEMIPFFKLFAFADSLDVVLIVLGSIGALTSGTAQPLMTLLFGRLIDSFGDSSNDFEKLVSEISNVALLYVYTGLGAAVASCLEVTCWMISGERQASRIRCLYLKAILRQDVSFFDREVGSGEVLSRISEDTVLIQDAVGEKLGSGLQLFSRFFTGFFMAFYGSWMLTIVLLAVIPVLAVVGGFLASSVSTLAMKGQAAYTEAGSVVIQALTSIRTVACYGGEKKAVEAYDRALEKAEEAGVKQGVALGCGVGMALFVMFDMYALALWFGSRLVADGDLTAGQVVNVLFSVVMGGMALGNLSPSISASASGRAAAFKIFEVISRKSEIDITDLKGLVPDSINGDIELRNVTFAYPTRSEVPIFFNFNLFVPAGTTVALVGESGSGKSSVLSLVERFYDPQAGQVLLDGVDIKSIQLKWLRQQIALVSQEPVLFFTSIMENIAYGKEGATLEEVQAAARVANASTFIGKLPKGYETQVGERGIQLSGGQKQRIAIARAILKNPRILLLDEATSALDADSERLVQEALEKVITSRTTLVVAHRLSTIKNADLIAVIRNGIILETGTHAELIENPDGGYNQLIRIQDMQQAEVEEVALENFVDHLKVENTLETSGSSSPFSEGTSFDGTRQVSVRSRKISRSRSQQTEESLRPEARADTDVELGVERSVPTLVEDEEKGRKGNLWRLAKMNKSETPYFIVGSIGAAAQGLIFPLFGLLMSAIIEMLFKPPTEIRKEGRFWALMLVALAIWGLLTTPIQRWCFAVIGCSLVRRVRKESLSQVLRQEIGWFDDDKNSSGAVGGRLYSDAGAMRGVVGDALSLIVQNIATIVAGLTISFPAGWELSCVVLATVPLLGLQGSVSGQKMKEFAESTKTKYEKASRVANDAVSNIRTVASFCAEDKVMNVYEEHCKEPLKNGVKGGLVSGLYMGLANFTLFASYSLAFWAGSKFVSMGRMPVENVFRVFLAITMSSIAVMQSFTMAPDLAKARAAIASVFGILDRKSEIDPMNKAGKTMDNLKGLIEFRHVHFRYPARPDVPVLQDLSFILPAGQTLALVGESGSGKSTVISLLERFYDPNSGSILIDNFDIRTLQLEWLRKQIGLVSQEPVLFDGTIKMNIMYGKEAVTQQEIEAAATSANAHNFITSLPNLYETPVGSRKITLSGGQRQRVAIARAIIRDPKILLLDEATSALDAESEQVVHEALERISKHRTTIVVAHRLSTVRNATQIGVMKNGRIIEIGTYDQLISRQDSAFSALVNLSNNVRSKHIASEANSDTNR